jgi:SecD/SecF fusion protein
MQRKYLFRSIIILLLVGWAFYALWPTYRLHQLTPEKKDLLATKGELVPLMDRSIRLGLDLQGGIYMTLEVDLSTLITQLARATDARLDTILQQIQQELNVRNVDFLDLLVEQIHKRGLSLNDYWGERGDSDNKILTSLRKEAKDAMDRSLEILRNRVDQFGVSEPTIQHIGSTRILIELPGLSDPTQAKNLIGKTALLEFCLLKDPALYTDVLEKIDKALARKGAAPILENVKKTEAEAPATKTEKLDRKDKTVSVSEIFGKETPPESNLRKSADDTSAVVDENIFKENPFFSLLGDARRYGHEVSAPVKNVPIIQRILDRPDIQRIIPYDAQFLWSSETFKIGDESYQELYLVSKEAEVTGKYLTNAQVTMGSDAENAGRPVVNFTLNRQGARIFSRVTGANLKKRLAIVLDKKIFSAPTIQSKIPNGSGIITGMPDMNEAKLIAIVLKAGALPAPVSVIEERTIGPSLGRDSIKSGTSAALLGAGLVVLFMIVYYRAAGLLANFALTLNIFILIAALAQFRFTLTMPGIAGIVLTIGMAVDANVLIFERIREELRTGKTVRASIESGYTKAFSAIFDSNFTTIISSVALYWLGTGPVKGFAVTLTIGLIINMFTAIVVTRNIYDHITIRKTLTKLSI